MAWRPEHDPDEEEDALDPESPDESDMDDDDDPEMLPCPYCGKPISEDAEISPKCGSFLSIEDAPRRGITWWKLLVVALLVLVPVILRGVLESRLAEMTGRAVSIADIDLNIFTGRMGITRMRLSQKGSNAPAV